MAGKRLSTKKRLTKLLIQTLLKNPGEHRDEKSEAGLVLRVSPRGKATWFVEFDFKGKHHNTALGRVPNTPNVGKPLPEMQLDDARSKARAYRLIIENPADLAEPVTLRAAFEDYVQHKRRRPHEISHNLAAKSQKSYMAAFNQHLRAYESVDYRSLGEKEWRAIHTEVETGKTPDGQQVMLRPRLRTLKDGTVKEMPAQASKGSIAQAHVLLAAVSAMYEFHRVANPIKLLRQAQVLSRPPRSRKTWVKFDELHLFMRALQGLSSAVARQSLLVSLLSCFRRELVLGMRKDRLDCDACTYLVEETDEGYKRAPTCLFPLNRWLVETVLRPLKESSARPHPTFLFPSSTGKTETTSSLATSIDALERAFGKRINSNDLRRTFTTVAEWVGTTDTQLDRLTGHSTSTPFQEKGSKFTGEYIMTETEMLRPALNRISNTILELAGVLPLGRVTRARLAEDMPTLLATLRRLAINAKTA